MVEDGESEFSSSKEKQISSRATPLSRIAGFFKKDNDDSSKKVIKKKITISSQSKIKITLIK